jgi:hypothetical protein
MQVAGCSKTGLLQSGDFVHYHVAHVKAVTITNTQADQQDTRHIGVEQW